MTSEAIGLAAMGLGLVLIGFQIQLWDNGRKLDRIARAIEALAGKEDDEPAA